MQTALEVHESLQTQAKKLNNQNERVIPKMEVGQAFRQGDLYITKLESLPQDIINTIDLQLAQGETKGSRHILAQNVNYTVKVYNLRKPGPLDGPVFKSDETIRLTHPEHAHFVFPAGCYSTHYQQDYQAAEIRAVKD